MDVSAIIVGVLALIGTLVGSYFTGNKTTALILYRLEALEAKQDKHNNAIERLYACEKRLDVQEEKLKVANNRIADLEKH